MIRFLLALWFSVFVVTIARLRRGPLLPSWSWGFELVTRAQKRFHTAVARRPPLQQRRAWAGIRSRGPALRRVRLEREQRGGVPVVWFVPPEADDFGPVVLYLHGGSFIFGSEQSYGDVCARLAMASGARVAFVDYRLAPEHPFPAALDDARTVYLDLLRIGHPVDRLLVAGDSAGGNLTLALLLRLRDEGHPLPQAAIPISPWVDLPDRSGSMASNECFDWASPWMFDVWQAAYVPDNVSAADPWVSPARGDLTGLPPLLLVIGSAELLYDQAMAFAKKAQAAGVDVSTHVGNDMIHNWMAHASMFRNCQAVFDSMGEFVRARTA
jgi:epsilon-lactone hydrolase